MNIPKINFKTLAIILLFFSEQTLTAQTKADSLLQILKHSDERKQAEIYNKLADILIYDNYDKSGFYAKKALELSIKFGDKNNQAIAYAQIGNSYFFANNYSEARKNFEYALKLQTELGNMHEVGGNKRRIGNVLLYQNNFSEALKYYHDSYKICKETRDTSSWGLAAGNIATAYYMYGNMDSSLKYHEQKAEMMKAVKDELEYANALSDIGVIYEAWGNYDLALQNYLQVLEIYEKQKHTRGIAVAYDNIANIYSLRGEKEKAIESALKSLDNEKLVENNSGIAYSYQHLAAIYYQFKELEKAKEFSFKSLELFTKLNDIAGLASVNILIGDICLQSIQYNDALKYFYIALNYAAQISDKKSLINAYHGIGKVHFYQGKTDAVIYFEKSTNIALEQNIKPMLVENYQFISDFYYKTGDYKKAYEYFAKKSAIQDSLNNENRNLKIKQLQVDFETRDKAKEIENLTKVKEIQQLELNKKQLLIYFVFTALILLGLLITAMLYANRQKRRDNIMLTQQKQEIAKQRDNLDCLNKELEDQKLYVENQRDLIEAELKETLLKQEVLQRENIQFQFEALKNQINPHFLFNNFSTLVNLIPENTSLAEKYVYELSDVYRYILTSSQNELQKLQDEINFINSYMFLVSMRFDDNVNLDIQIDPNYMNWYLPLLSVQLLVENATKHNIISSKKQLYINIFTEEDMLIVKNNLQMKSVPEESTGLGLKNLEKRYKLLTNKPLEVIKTQDEYIVKLPLIKHALKF
jgi:sensor histidine kinase YesM